MNSKILTGYAKIIHRQISNAFRNKLMAGDTSFIILMKIVNLFYDIKGTYCV